VSLQGEFEIIPEGGSMAARNVPQDRQDAGIFINQLMQNPYIDPKRPLMRGLELLGVRDPEAWLKKTDPPVPPLALEALQKMGVNPALIRRAVHGGAGFRSAAGAGAGPERAAGESGDGRERERRERLMAAVLPDAGASRA
jgi:hypothetical protein